MKILVDAFGGDNSPGEIIAGTVNAVNKEKGFTAVLVGKQDVIEEELKKYSYDKERIEILNASEVITCEEEPTVAIRKKPDSSLCVAFAKLRSDDQAKAFVSAGSTGAVLVGATLKLGRISGVNRPALCPILPTMDDGEVVFLDCGANADCKSINLYQFAVMGSVFAKAMGKENPRVALLSNGTEDAKGNALVHETLPLLYANKDINFLGNTEARDILSGKFDVIVTDGFSGNVALKSLECAVVSIMKTLKNTLTSSFKNKLGALLLKKDLYKMKDKLDYNKRGGALFLGANKIVIKAHGSSKALTIESTILQAYRYAKAEITEKIREEISKTLANTEQV